MLWRILWFSVIHQQESAIYFQGSNGEMDIENRPMDKVGGEEGEGEMCGESNIEIHSTMCKTDSQLEFAVYSGYSNRGSAIG